MSLIGVKADANYARDSERVRLDPEPGVAPNRPEAEVDAARPVRREEKLAIDAVHVGPLPPRLVRQIAFEP